MTHVVCEPCYDCKYTDCCVVCPVTCFYEDEFYLYIHPEDCIDCEACVPECPVEAIFADSKVPEQWKDCIAMNDEKAKALKDKGEGNLSEKKDAKEGPACKKKG